MYGWEFPPRMSGGLGTACYGMTKALAGLGNEILFVVPGLEMIDANPSIRLIAAGETPSAMASSSLAPFESILVRMVHSPLRPYMNARQYSELTDGQGRDRCGSYLAAPAIYGEDLMAEVLRYSQAAAEIAAAESAEDVADFEGVRRERRRGFQRGEESGRGAEAELGTQGFQSSMREFACGGPDVYDT